MNFDFSMKILYIVLLTCLTLGKGSARRSHHRIIGGKTAKRAQFPYMVSIQSEEGHICGGSIVSSQYVLTAAHCVNGGNFKLYVGSNDLKSSGTTYSIKRVVRHPGWNPDQPLDNDIALLKTAKPMRPNQSVKPVPLPPKPQSVPIGSAVTAAGWGLTQLSPPVKPNMLQYLETHVVESTLCSVHKNIICAGGIVGHDMCLTDSGGPLVYEGMVVGVLSHIKPCAVGVPSFFTKVAAYRDWIDGEMRK